MARIMVDSDKLEVVTEWGYLNKNGVIEYVDASESFAVCMYCSDKNVLNEIYYEDIPNMIKALQAAYNYKQGEKI